MIVEIPKSVFQYGSLEASVSVLTSRKLRFSAPWAFNDPFEFSTIPEGNLFDGYERLGPTAKAFCRRAPINLLRKPVRISCYSEDVTNPLMWAHYGQNGWGVSMEYSPKSLDLSLHSEACVMRKVVYDDNFHPILVRDAPSWKNSIEEIYVHKSSEWAYEKEWRIIKFDPRGTLRMRMQNRDQLRGVEYLDFKPSECVKGAYFGPIHNPINLARMLNHDLGIPDGNSNPERNIYESAILAVGLCDWYCLDLLADEFMYYYYQNDTQGIIRLLCQNPAILESPYMHIMPKLIRLLLEEYTMINVYWMQPNYSNNTLMPIPIRWNGKVILEGMFYDDWRRLYANPRGESAKEISQRIKKRIEKSHIDYQTQLSTKLMKGYVGTVQGGE